jgi:hypothetical protein
VLVERGGGSADYSWSADVAAHGRSFVVGSDGLRHYALPDGRFLGRLEGSIDPPHLLLATCSTDGPQAFSARDGFLLVWDLASRQRIAQWSLGCGDHPRLRAVGDLVTVTDHDGAMVWNWRTGMRIGAAPAAAPPASTITAAHGISIVRSDGIEARWPARLAQASLSGGVLIGLRVDAAGRAGELVIARLEPTAG